MPAITCKIRTSRLIDATTKTRARVAAFTLTLLLLTGGFLVGTQASRLPAFSKQHASLQHSSLITHHSSLLGIKGPHRQIKSEFFHLTFPTSLPTRDAESVIDALELARKDLNRRISAAGLHLQLPVVEVVLNETTGDFVGRTGQPWWAAAATAGNKIELQPLALLKQRGILQSTIRHELVHAALSSSRPSQAPRWLEEGLALYVAGEGQMLAKYLPEEKRNGEEIERMLNDARSVEEMRTAYALAYQLVDHLRETRGETRLWRQALFRNN